MRLFMFAYWKEGNNIKKDWDWNTEIIFITNAKTFDKEAFNSSARTGEINFSCKLYYKKLRNILLDKGKIIELDDTAKRCFYVLEDIEKDSQVITLVLAATIEGNDKGIWRNK